jgi:hypothetical protein
LVVRLNTTSVPDCSPDPPDGAARPSSGRRLLRGAHRPISSRWAFGCNNRWWRTARASSLDRFFGWAAVETSRMPSVTGVAGRTWTVSHRHGRLAKCKQLLRTLVGGVTLMPQNLAVSISYRLHEPIMKWIVARSVLKPFITPLLAVWCDLGHFPKNGERQSEANFMKARLVSNHKSLTPGTGAPPPGRRGLRGWRQRVIDGGRGIVQLSCKPQRSLRMPAVLLDARLRERHRSRRR